MMTTSWPVLPSTAFVSGRAAQESDVKIGHAIFHTTINGEVAGRPAPIAVPQFAYFIADDRSRIPVVVVQAEISERATVLGLRDVQGREYVATEKDVILLGQTHP
jgi:hypothetical protein